MKFPEAKTTENLLFQTCSFNSGKRIYSGYQEQCFPTVPKDILYNLSKEHLKSIQSPGDEQSVEMHIKSMQQEMKSATPSLDKLTDSMTRTFYARRHWVIESRPPMHELLQQYPALERPELIFH
ncbi:hypothetical protein MRX96_019813 [Rhipicephalus microplus]